MKNVKITMNDGAMNNYEAVIDMDKVEPRLIVGNEPNILVGKDDSGNAIGIFDEFCGEYGKYVSEGDFSKCYEIAMTNLRNHYYLNDFEFNAIEGSQVYKFDCQCFTRTAKSIMLLKSLQDAVADLIGEQVYFVVSDRGNLYVSLKEESFESIMYPILDNDGARLEQEFVLYTLDENGKYLEEKRFLRGDY